MGGLKQQKCVLSPLGRPKAEGESDAGLAPSSGGGGGGSHLTGIPALAGASLKSPIL